MADSDITASRLREVLRYDADTGKFHWLVSHQKIKRGDVAGAFTSKGYIRIKIDGRTYRAHRLAWFYVTGEWPKDEIDHRNTDKADNRISNLREASRSINEQNKRVARADNVSAGLLGVSKTGRTWQAQIEFGEKKHYIGKFKTPEDAHAAYIEAKRKLHEGCTI